MRGRHWARLLLVPYLLGLAIVTGAVCCWAEFDGWLHSAVIAGLIPVHLMGSAALTPRRYRHSPGRSHTTAVTSSRAAAPPEISETAR